MIFLDYFDCSHTCLSGIRWCIDVLQKAFGAPSEKSTSSYCLNWAADGDFFSLPFQVFKCDLCALWSIAQNHLLSHWLQVCSTAKKQNDL